MRRWIYKTFKKDAFEPFNWEVDTNKSIQDTCFVVFDTETTGLDLKKDFPISIGAIKVEDLSFSFSDAFYEIIKPPKGFEESIKVHGITPMDLEHAKDIKTVCEEFLEYSRGCVFVGYFVHIDVGMIRRTVESGCNGVFSPYAVDILDLYRLREPNKTPKLEEMLKELNLPVSHAHNALEDAYMSALAFLKLVMPYKDKPLKALPLRVL